MLFSDVEQSTLLLTRLGRGYERALDRCRLAQRAAWAACDGAEMGTEGDSFFVVFSTAENAVRAAAEAQRALAAREWPDGEQVRVRMGIHTGSPRIHDNGYVGIDVHRAARIAAVAHGAQVVVSDATAKLVAGSLPEGVSLRDLGGHRLKDLSVPEHLYQLQITGLEADFPLLKSLGTTSSLPNTTTPLVGRESEVAELAGLLVDPKVRLVTLIGPGGSGKTRLAIAAAREVVEGFPDGVYFVPLAAITSAEVIWSSIGEVLDLPVLARTPPAFFGHVAGLRAVFMLDNLEQVRGAATVVDTLLHAAPDVVVLATSRSPLHLTSEHQYGVSPLAAPSADTLAAAEASPAVQLFVDRARAVRASFALTSSNVSQVAAICRHLDGLPLAIELAAARSKVLGPRALLARLAQALDLHGPAADRPARHQTLRDTIDWSYRLLLPREQALFRRLGVFAGGADLEALVTVCGDGAVTGDPVDLVADLVDASLVTVAEDLDGEPRFALLQTVRAFARDTLVQTGELEEVCEVHAWHFVGVASLFNDHVYFTNREQAIRGFHVFDLERSNFREALTWATSAPSGPEPATGVRGALGLALLSGVCSIWNVSNPVESRHWLEAVLEVANGAETAERGRCLVGYSEVLLLQGDLLRALEVARRSVAMLRALDDWHLPEALGNLGDVETALGDSSAGRRAYEEAVELARQSGYQLILAQGLGRLADLEEREENWEESLQLYLAGRRLVENFSADHFAAVFDHNIACVLRKLGRVEDAHELMSTSLAKLARLVSPLMLVPGVEDYGAVLVEAGFARFAPLLLAACDAERERLAVPRPDRQEREIVDARRAAKSELTPTEWADEYARGRRLTVLDALAEALSSTTDLRI